MSIRELEKINSRQMENLQRKQSREINQLTDAHEMVKIDIKKSNDSEIVELQNENMRHVASENDKREKVLEQMKNHLDQSRKMTDSQIKDLKDNSLKTKKDEHEKLSIDRERIKSDNDLYLEDLGHRLTNEHKKIVGDNRDQVRVLKDSHGLEISSTEDHFQDKIRTQTSNFTQRFQTDERNQKKIKDDQDKQFKTERMNTNVRQQQDMGKLTESHNKHLQVRDKEFRRGIKDQDLVFEKKYSDSLQTKNEDMKRLDDLNTKVLTKMKSDLKETLETSVKRSDDPFYRFTQLNPTLKQFEDRVEISVAIPDHAKTDIQLTIHDKEAIINFDRRYDDSRKEAGTTSKLHKVESFTSRLMTNIHLDPKSVKSKYEDGVMTYSIKQS
jgi:HSP20 family molecular chaperone IbpA